MHWLTTLPEKTHFNQLINRGIPIFSPSRFWLQKGTPWEALYPAQWLARGNDLAVIWYNMNMKPETKLWLSLADDDYRNATLLWENHRYGATIFFSQQAVEKILKAYVIE